MAGKAARNINLNTATLNEMKGLGINPEAAQALINFREANGPFESWEDLKAVAGFTPDLIDGVRKKGAVLGEVLEIESHGD